ncbi:hypothetical protein B0H16DRAFT_1638072 [Mycena metata]|uniref:F-box domain-containing protein n=1 Tax=Mycena metata TaxID=1033252 RepID=A0AAD7GSH3_9AGAR|nr:hypothetical protein B0H16DRAFT_1638072 [Mycena metata]
MSSRFHSKLGTNYCAQDEETVEIRGILADPTLRLRLKNLDDEIARLQKALDELAAERAKLVGHVEAHLALISPARRLPPDLLGEVFVACLPKHRNCAMSATEAPVLLGRVCSSWRTISLSTPRLWSSLHIAEPTWQYDLANVPRTFVEQKLVQRIEAAKAWLIRSGQCPLSISLQSSWLRDSPSDTPEHIIPTLLSFASRWACLDLSIPSSALLAMSQLTAADVPMLQTVKITQTDTTQDTIGPLDSLAFLGGREIHSFSLKGRCFWPFEGLCWDRLIEISIGFPDADSNEPRLTVRFALQLLSRCPQLQSFGFQFLDADPDSDAINNSGPPILELSFLHAMDLDCTWRLSEILDSFFSRLSLPQLRKLKLEGERFSSESVSYRPLYAAAPRIESLDCPIGLFPETALFTDFLVALPPTLRELKLHHAYEFHHPALDPAIFESVILAPELWCPCLETLEITSRCSFSDEALVRFIKSRALKRVVLRFSRPMELDVQPALQGSVENGLHLELSYPQYNVSPWEGQEQDD